MEKSHFRPALLPSQIYSHRNRRDRIIILIQQLQNSSISSCECSATPMQKYSMLCKGKSVKRQREKRGTNCPGNQVAQISASVFVPDPGEAKLPDCSTSCHPSIASYWVLAGL